MRKNVKYYLAFLLSLSGMTASAADLFYLGKPIDALCFFNLENNSNVIKLNECGIKKEKYIIKNQDNDLLKRGFIGFEWKETGVSYPSAGYSYYKVFPASNKQYWLYTINNSGGSGEFTAINLIKRKNDSTLEMKAIITGDRCNGGIQEVRQQDGHLNFSVNLTAYDFIALTNQNVHHVQAYDDLAACATCCAAKAVYDMNSNATLKLIYIDMGENKNPEEMSTQGKYQLCFNNLFTQYVTHGKTKLNEAQLKQFVTEFNGKCVK